MRVLIALVLSCFCSAALLANNVQVSNVQVITANQISFHVTWENSWRLSASDTPGNYDALWIFLKYRGQDGIWRHLDLSATAADHNSNEFEIEAVSDEKGIFIYRTTLGSGTAEGDVTVQMARYMFAGTYDFKVFAIEMVRVPEGSFYLGDGASNWSFRRGDKFKPLMISSEGGITLGADSLSLNDTGKYAPAAPIPAGFPKGYSGFYCMKYEISQEQYADFLNSLTFNQQTELTASSPASSKGTLAFGSRNNRFGIVIEQPGENSSRPAVYACDAVSDNIFNQNNDGQNRACNFLDWNGLTAYLDWAALRPMTELEFEKACRGPLLPIAKEFAWGTDLVADANSIENDGTPKEGVPETWSVPVNTGVASHGYAGPQGPLRNGFAGTSTSDRLRIGAGYYGVLEMSGNLWEACVNVSTEGLKFTPTTGDGELDQNGKANVSTWPGSNGVATRGGGWNSGIVQSFRDLAISDRFYGEFPHEIRRSTIGGRGVR